MSSDLPQTNRPRLTTRRCFIRTLLGAGAAGLAAGCASTSAVLSGPRSSPSDTRPNIVIILADDMGFADVGFNGCRDIPTPHIDAIARSGVRFAQGYVSCPVCSPTRAGILTGRYQQRFGHELNPLGLGVEDPTCGLPLAETTLADDLKAAGYATGVVGKWHLGASPQFHPQRRGFDEFFGFLAGAHTYMSSQDRRAGPLLRGSTPVEEKEYLTDAFTREAVSFIDRHAHTPFLLYLAYNAVHNPLEAPAEYLDRFPGIADSKRRSYAAMQSSLDDGVGAVVAVLGRRDLLDNTLLFLLSDNGGPESQNASDNGPCAWANPWSTKEAFVFLS